MRPANPACRVINDLHFERAGEKTGFTGDLFEKVDANKRAGFGDLVSINDFRRTAA